MKPSSSPAFQGNPSSHRPFGIVRHDEIVSAGPGIAKGTLLSATSVQRGREFSACRSVLGWSQDDAAVKYGVHVRTIRRWERGETEISARDMDDIRARAALGKVGT